LILQDKSWVRCWIVIPVVVGSSPISHPKNSVAKTKGYMLDAGNPLFFEDPDLKPLKRLFLRPRTIRPEGKN
jgi:hypothetical protein